MLPGRVAERIDSYLALVDEALPGAVEGLYVHGSIALGSWMPDRSDIDLVVVIGDDAPFDPAALRRAHRSHHDRDILPALVGRRWPLQCNTSYVRWRDLARPAPSATPLASHVARTFAIGSAFDANPVTWRILARSPVALRGPAQPTVHDDDALLRSWTRQNLHDYWAGWARTARRGNVRTRMQWLAAPWAALGSARMHCTITTGEVVSKEAAGAYALDTFDARWRPLIETALRYRRSELGTYSRAGRSRLEAADFVDMVIADVG